MDRTNLLPIGQFAQASGLSVTALRHYDASGVLPPARVDPDSGYRYYRRDQLRAAQLIRSLRQLDIPIEQVRGLLERSAAGRDISAELRAHLAAAERRLEIQRSVVHGLLDRLSEGGAMNNHRVTIRQGAAMRALTCGATVNQPSLDAFARTSCQEMYTVAGRAPLTLSAPASMRYHGLCNEESECLVEACLPFSATAAQPTDLPDGMYVLDIPEATYACATVQGDAAVFPAIQSAYDAVANWITEHGFAFAGPVQEIFRHWTGTLGHPENRLEIAWPIA